jgi:hypothetical protein
VNSEDPDVFKVLVLDLDRGKAIGHRLLDLNARHGLHE